MEKGLKELLESAVLNDDTKAAFLEAMNNKIENVKKTVREEIESTVRSELSERYNHDKAVMIEAMDNMLTDAVKVNTKKTYEETKKLREERVRLTKTIQEARKSYKNKIVEHTKNLEQFIMNKLSEEITEFKQEKHSLKESQKVVKRSLREHRNEIDTQSAKRINNLEKFVMGQLSKEVKEFKQDKNSLDKMRIRLAIESKAKLEETRKLFIKRASKLVENTVQAQLHKEMSQLKEDIRIARENTFARRIFEAFQSEYMTSYLNEHSKINQLTKKLSETQKSLNEAKVQIKEKNSLFELSQRKAQINEERAKRNKILDTLLRPLNKEKREIMESLLESVKTVKLDESFQRYLPAVINNTAKDKAKSRGLINETTRTNNTVTFTGDRTKRLSKNTSEEDNQEQNSEILDLRRLAGL